jgi:hypothetical protein
VRNAQFRLSVNLGPFDGPMGSNPTGSADLCPEGRGEALTSPQDGVR